MLITTLIVYVVIVVGYMVWYKISDRSAKDSESQDRSTDQIQNSPALTGNEDSLMRELNEKHYAILERDGHIREMENKIDSYKRYYEAADRRADKAEYDLTALQSKYEKLAAKKRKIRIKVKEVVKEVPVQQTVVVNNGDTNCAPRECQGYHGVSIAVFHFMILLYIGIYWYMMGKVKKYRRICGNQRSEIEEYSSQAQASPHEMEI